MMVGVDLVMTIGAFSCAQPLLVLVLIEFEEHQLVAVERIWLLHIHKQGPLLLHLLHIPLN
jgi:hypothetical protein